ncbi:MAG: hypothetical protein ACRC78_17600 [Planktothrix sp.]
MSNKSKEKYLFWEDGRVSVWDDDLATFLPERSTTVEKLRNRVQSLLDIISELQETPKSLSNLGDDNPDTVFGKNARHRLLEAGAVVQNKCPSRDPKYGANAVAITLTLPGSTPEAKRALAALSSWVVNNLLQTIRDCSVDLYEFFVWELQERGALHIHQCLGAPPDDCSIDELKVIAKKIVDKWFQLLKLMAGTDSISRGGKKGNLPGIDMFERSEKAISRGGPKTWRDNPEKWQWDIQPINKDVAAYFSKYASKNAEAGNKKSIISAYSPSRWWGKNKLVMDEIKANRFDYTVAYCPGETDDLIETGLEVFPPVCEYEYSFLITTKSFKIEYNPELESETIDIDSEVTMNVVNGFTKVTYWKREEFREVWQLFKDLKPTFSEVGYYRKLKSDIPVHTVDATLYLNKL